MEASTDTFPAIDRYVLDVVDVNGRGQGAGQYKVGRRNGKFQLTGVWVCVCVCVLLLIREKKNTAEFAIRRGRGRRNRRNDDRKLKKTKQ